MSPPADSVLVLYNLPPDEAVRAAGALYDESMVGVLDEVAVVSAALETVGIACRSVGIRALAELPPVLLASPERIVFNLVEWFPEQPTDAYLVPAVCKAFAKEYTGNTTPCQVLAANKWQTSGVLRNAGLPCPQSFIVEHQQAALTLPFDPPYIVKPLCTDASEGITAASVIRRKSRPALLRAVATVAQQCRQPALIEAFIDGREVNVSLLQDGDSVRVLPLAEIEFRNYKANKPRIIDYAAKWLPHSFEYQNTVRVVPALLAEETAAAITRCARAAWQTTGCRDYARVDLRLDPRNRPWILEVNPNPDISPNAGFAAALTAAGLTFEMFVQLLVRNALKRLRDAPDEP